MKKILAILFILIFLAAIPISIYLVMQRQELRKEAAPATSLSFEPSTVSKRVGETITFNVTMDTAENEIWAMDIFILYDATKLEGISFAPPTQGAPLPAVSNSGDFTVEGASGRASITMAVNDMYKPFKGSATTAVISFKALSSTTTPIQIRFSMTGNFETYAGAKDEGAANVIINASPATVTITEDPSNSPTPTATTAPSQNNQNQASQGQIQILNPKNGAAVADTTPTISGTAPSGSSVTITIYPESVTGVITTSSNGSWSFTPKTPLSSGPHDLVASSQNDTTQETLSASLSFVISPGASQTTPQTTSDENAEEDAAADEDVTPVSGKFETTMIIVAVALILIFSGFFGFSFRIK